MKKTATSNDEIADTLDHVADLLELEGESSFRVRSYRNAAQTIRDLDTPVRTLMKQDGEHLLKDLPGIGDKLAGSIKEIATTGRLGLAERLEHETWPGQLFTEVPGIGPELARRIHDQLKISTLEELEVAAHDRAPGASGRDGAPAGRGRSCGLGRHAQPVLATETAAGSP